MKIESCLNSAQTQAVSLALCVFLPVMGCTSRRVLRTERVKVGEVLVQSTPAAKVFIDGRAAGQTPIKVPVHRIRRDIQISTSEIDEDAALTGGIVVGIFAVTVPVVAPIYLLMAADMSVNRQTNEKEEWEETRKTVRLKREGYRSEQMRISSENFPRQWRPVLAQLSREPTPEEIARKVARTAGEATKDVENIRHTLRGIVDESVNTIQNLCGKEWETNIKK